MTHASDPRRSGGAAGACKLFRMPEQSVEVNHRMTIWADRLR